MGIFNFWNKKTEQVSFSNLDEWLNKKLQEKKLDKMLEEFKKELILQSNKAVISLEDLEKAELINQSIPVKEKQIMDGHRKIYIQRIKKFLQDIKQPSDFSEVGHYAAIFSEATSKLSQDIAKNQTILSNFFNNHILDIKSSLKSIEMAFSKLQSDIDKANVETIREGKIKIKQYNSDVAKKERLESEQNRLYADSDILRKKKNRIEIKLDELKKSQDYESVKDLFENKKNNEVTLTHIDQELITQFAHLNRPLKKYTYNTANEKLADRYIADPAGMLQDDENLIIADLLSKLSNDIEKMDMNEKQINNAKTAMEKLTQDFLKEKKNQILDIKSSNKEIATKINKSIITLNIAENESWVKSLDSKISDTEREIQRIKKDIEEINLDYLKQKVKEKAKEIDPTIKIED